MRVFRLIFAGLSIISGGLAGCAPGRYYSSSSPILIVKDAQTLSPISNASITLKYHRVVNRARPSDQTYMTNVYGEAGAEICGHPHELNVSAPGYESAFDYPERLLVDPDNDHVIDVFLFKLPKPAFEIVVSPDYVGPLFIGFKPTPTPGQRLFRSNATPSGYVQFPAPANVDIYDNDKINFRFISSDPDRNFHQEIRYFMPVSPDGARRAVFVGSREEFSNWMIKTGFDFDWGKMDLYFEKSEGAGKME